MSAATGDQRICIVGGAGRAGLPLGLALARAGARVDLYDLDAARISQVNAGVMPFAEFGANELLPYLIETGRLRASASAEVVRFAETIVIIVGTPIDEFLNPSMSQLERCVESIAPYMSPRMLVVLRSTVYPGTSQWLRDALAARGVDADVAMCPERITEGNALEELASLPQIVGADDERVAARAEALFKLIAPTTVRTTTKEAELAKLFTNAWRYMKFAVANHFFMISDRAGVDHTRILQAVRHDYPRASDLPGPGFAAGPCLLKDTMQLAAFDQGQYLLAQAAMVVNEGLPDYIVRKAEMRSPLRGRTIGILGMAFKSESDDPRASLSYKLRKLLVRIGANVLCTDPYVADRDLVPLERVLQEAEIVIIAAPHGRYRTLDLTCKEVIDVWGLHGPIQI